jgi:hypothetical protein
LIVWPFLVGLAELYHGLDIVELLQLAFVKRFELFIQEVPVPDVADLLTINLVFLKELWLDTTFSLFHDVLVAKLELDLLNALHVCIGYLTILITIAFLNYLRPFNALEFEVEIKYVVRVKHVDECKAYATLCPEILREIKVIVLPLKVLIDEVHHVKLIELDRNVSYHECCLF